jgi:hypothetical protein
LRKHLAWTLSNTMDALIARLFYSCGLSFNIARSLYYLISSLQIYNKSQS